VGSTQRRYILIDATRLSVDERILLTSLQGTLNRRGPTLYGIFDPAWDSDWVLWYAEHGFEGQKWTLDDALAPLLPETSGAILYDPELFCTVGIAASMAGEHEGIVCSPRVAMRLGVRDLLDDLRGRWKSEIDAYSWAMENVFPRCANDIFCTLPMEDPSTFDPRTLDIAIARGAFVNALPVNEAQFPEESSLCRAMMAALEPKAIACGQHTHRDSEADYLRACTAAGLIPLPSLTPGNLSFHQHINFDELLAAHAGGERER